MASFDAAIDYVLRNEGGFSNNPLDPGGATNFGVSLRFYKTIKPDATEEDIRNLTIDKAKDIYRAEFWEKNKYNLIANQRIATKVFDFCINMGYSNANRCLQWAVLATRGRSIVADGIIGTQSLYAINNSNPDALYAALKSEAAGYYRLLIGINKNLEIFERGWLNRCYSDV